MAQYENSALERAVALAFDTGRPAIYQRAEIKNGFLRPVGQSAVKYREIAGIAKYLERDFSFADYGCAHGLFGFLLNQDFPGVYGKLVNKNRQEIDVCRKLVNILETESLEIVESDVLECEYKSDLTIYMSLIQHLLGEGVDIDRVVEMVVRQTGVVCVVEGTTDIIDATTGRRHEDCELKFVRFIEKLQEKMKVVGKTRMQPSENVVRFCYVLKK